MDFVWLAGFVMTICQLALQIRGDEGEFNFFYAYMVQLIPDT